MILRRHVLGVAVVVLALAGGGARHGAEAQTPATDIGVAEQTQIRLVIERQIDAFRRDDGADAFGFASPTIQGLFGSPDNFMAMVRGGFAPVYRPRAVEFDQLVRTGAALIQLVNLVGPDGAPVVAAYEMQLQPDRTWRINGCVLLPATSRAT